MSEEQVSQSESPENALVYLRAVQAGKLDNLSKEIVAELKAHSINSDFLDEFVKAGWLFFLDPETRFGDISYPVIWDKNKNINILTSSITVKFLPEIEEAELESILAAENLSIQRKMGFSKNSFLLSGEGLENIADVAKRLKDSGKAIHADQVKIEILKGRE